MPQNETDWGFKLCAFAWLLARVLWENSLHIKSCDLCWQWYYEVYAASVPVVCILKLNSQTKLSLCGKQFVLTLLSAKWFFSL